MTARRKFDNHLTCAQLNQVYSKKHVTRALEWARKTLGLKAPAALSKALVRLALYAFMTMPSGTNEQTAHKKVTPTLAQGSLLGLLGCSCKAFVGSKAHVQSAYLPLYASC